MSLVHRLTRPDRAAIERGEEPFVRLRCVASFDYRDGVTVDHEFPKRYVDVVREIYPEPDRLCVDLEALVRDPNFVMQYNNASRWILPTRKCLRVATIGTSWWSSPMIEIVRANAETLEELRVVGSVHLDSLLGILKTCPRLHTLSLKNPHMREIELVRLAETVREGRPPLARIFVEESHIHHFAARPGSSYKKRDRMTWLNDTSESVDGFIAMMRAARLRRSTLRVIALTLMQTAYPRECHLATAHMRYEAARETIRARKEAGNPLVHYLPSCLDEAHVREGLCLRILYAHRERERIGEEIRYRAEQRELKRKRENRYLTAACVMEILGEEAVDATRDLLSDA